MNIDLLQLTDEELELAKKQIERMAYERWREAGCPAEDTLKFWCQAEREWINYFYIPDREVEYASDETEEGSALARC